MSESPRFEQKETGFYPISYGPGTTGETRVAQPTTKEMKAEIAEIDMFHLKVQSEPDASIFEDDERGGKA